MKYYSLILILLLSSCSKDAIYQPPIEKYISPFGSKKEGEFKMSSQKHIKDNNGYYHYKFNRSIEYNYTDVVGEASAISNSYYNYNNNSVIEGTFDSNSFFILGDSVSVTIPLYNPFNSLYSSPYFTYPISTKTKTIILSQFKGFIVPLVATTKTYFKQYDYRMDDYKPSGTNMWTKRVIGPIPKYMIGDTIIIYGKASWDCGSYSIKFPQYTHKTDSLKLIID